MATAESPDCRVSTAEGFSRDATHRRSRVTADGRDGRAVELGHDRWLVRRACPEVRVRDLLRPKGFGDTVDVAGITGPQRTVHRGIDSTGIVPRGGELSSRSAAYDRQRLGGEPFGTGRPPGLPPPEQAVPAGLSPLSV